MKKHTKQIVWGIILFVIGGIIIPTIFCVIVFTYMFTNKPLAKFTIPGQAIVTIEEQGRYYLWNNYQTIFEGKTYSSSQGMPDGLEISLLEKTNGDPVIFVSDLSITSSSGNTYKNSVGYFEVEQPATYILSVLGETEPRVCSLGTSIFAIPNVLIFLSTFALGMSIGVSGFVLVVIGVINLIKAGKNEKIDAGANSA